MEGHPCDPASTNWTFAFFEEVHHRDPEDQSGYFFRLDAKTGVPMRREFPLIIDLGNWTNVGFSSNGYLFYRSCVNPFDIDSADRSPIPDRCYVANYFTNQTMFGVLVGVALNWGGTELGWQLGWGGNQLGWQSIGVAPNRVAPDRVAPNRVAPNRVAINRVAPIGWQSIGWHRNRVAINRVAPNRVAPNRVAPNRVAWNRVAMESGARNRVAPIGWQSNRVAPNRVGNQSGGTESGWH
ncbi:hypothetical protein H6P81_000200 [Aristolochia fimbriata]|uniref:Uncharacterized protein n=1 Tax=Aristolochia fimbriata TaxID=158543 RepID=A0AAV7F3L3_ARIFI|nr:hypothetical protein H6P81_000200 [Aristolochia fimbriata]